MRYGMNLLLWSDVLSDEALPLLDQIREIGFDAVELPVFEVDAKKYAKWGKRLDDAGLARTAVTVRGVDDNPMSADPAVRRKGVEANKAVLECCQAAGAEALVGPYHSALGYFSGAGPTKDEWNWAVESMQEVAEYAEACNVTLALEYLNRFECYLLNTAADAARFCRDHNHRRWANLSLGNHGGHRAQRAGRGCLVIPGHATHDHHGRFGRLAAGHELLAPAAGAGHAHVEDERAGELGQGPIVQQHVLLAVPFLPGDQRHGRGVLGVGDGNAGIAGGGQGGGHAGHGLEGDARLPQGLGFFGAATKHVGIAALEADHGAARPGGGEHLRLDFLLGNHSLGAVVPQTDPFGSFGGIASQGRIDQIIDQDQLRLPQALGSPHRQQARIARPGTDQINVSQRGTHTRLRHAETPEKQEREGDFGRRRPLGSGLARRPESTILGNGREGQ